MRWGRTLLPAIVEYVWPDIMTLLCMGEASSAILPPVLRTPQYQFRSTLISQPLEQ
jgi:hypothetical protein